jgi:hypothetical protein
MCQAATGQDRVGGTHSRRSVIDRRELILILNAADGADQADALASLLKDGLVCTIVNGDAITAIRTTNKGDSALSAMTLPTATA